MSHSIEVQVLDRSCAAGDTYAAKHFTCKPKAAVMSCEGACLKGEVARRAANITAHTLEPDRAVRICHGGGLMLNQGGMRKLIEVAEQAIVVDGCGLLCGTRLAKAAFPEKKFNTVVANSLYQGDDSIFGVNEVPEEEIQAKAREVADQIVARYLTGCCTTSAESAKPKACCACP